MGRHGMALNLPLMNACLMNYSVPDQGNGLPYLKPTWMEYGS